MLNNPHKITIKRVRSFALGFVIYSPKLNGFCVEFHVTCIHICFWNRGKKLFGIKDYWKG